MARFVELRDEAATAHLRFAVEEWDFGSVCSDSAANWRGESQAEALCPANRTTPEKIAFSTVSRVSMSVNTWAAPSLAIRRSAAALPSICFATCLNSYAVPENARPPPPPPMAPPPLMNPPPPSAAPSSAASRPAASAAPPAAFRALRYVRVSRADQNVALQDDDTAGPHRTAGRAAKAPRMACDSLEEIRIHLMRKNLASPVQVSLRG